MKFILLAAAAVALSSCADTTFSVTAAYDKFQMKVEGSPFKKKVEEPKLPVEPGGKSTDLVDPADQ